MQPYAVTPSLPKTDSRPAEPPGVVWEEAVKIATILKSWDRPPGLVFIIGLDCRSPDDNRVILSVDLENALPSHKYKPPTLVTGFFRQPSKDDLRELDGLIRSWFRLGPKGAQ